MDVNIITFGCKVNTYESEIIKEKFLEIEEYSKLPKEVHEDYFLWLSFIKKGYYFTIISFFIKFML